MAETGITIRHTRSCTLPPDHKPNRDCRPTFQAHVWSAREKKRIRKTFPTLAAARAWRQDALPALRRRTMQAPTQATLRQAWEAWQADAKKGLIRNRSGDVFKPSVLRSYEASMRLRILEPLGGAKLSEIGRFDLQAIADEMLAAGRDPSTIRNAFMPLRSLYRREVGRSVAINPTAGLELPAVRGTRDRIADPTEASALLAALPEQERPVWATAFYAGLRLGELQALRDEDVDLVAGVVRVRRSWDKKEGAIEPKSRAGTRNVPIVAALRVHLVAHRLRRGSIGGLFFGAGEQAFNDDTVRAHAVKAWKAASAKAAAELEDELGREPKADELAAVTLMPIGFHEARHTYASISIAAGVNAKALSTYLGHASITITLDRYGHLMPGNEDEAVALVDGYLERATTARQS